jgi:predicted DNA-binding transcriptional regulator AlpA
MTDSIYLSEQQFCDRYIVSPRTAQRWRLTGDGPAWVRLGRRRVGYRLSDCEAWAGARTFSHRAAEIAGQSIRAGEADALQPGRRKSPAPTTGKAA